MFEISARWLIVLMGSATLVACGTESSGSSGSGSCKTDLECARGTICESGSCVVKACTSMAECGPDRLCVDGACTAIECNLDMPCLNGAECVNGLCEGGSGTTGGGTGGTPPADTPACDSCVDDANCGDGYLCVSVGPAKHCAMPCQSKSACTSGWECYETAEGVGTVCVPGLFACSGCLVEDDCPVGQHCNASTGACVADAQNCGACLTDGDCGTGLRCHAKEGTASACVPDCTGAACPATATCVSRDDGVQVCEWSAEGECCLDEGCSTAPPNPCGECAGTTPHCNGTQCVECIEDSQCPSDKPKCQGNTCLADSTPSCTGATPHYNPATDQCCECLNGTHCNGGTCDPGSCSCKAPATGNEVCDSCVAPYPGCAEFQGQWVCVQCSEDVHCPSGATCNLSNYTCEGGGSTPPGTGNCQTQGCNPPDLSCDPETGLCFDPGGNCDSVAQFCVNGGECIDLFSSLTSCAGGGGGGGLPPLPIPDAGGLPGSCSCQLGAGEIPGFGQGDCPSGFTCGPDPLMLIFCALSGGTPPNVCSSGSGGGLPFP